MRPVRARSQGVSAAFVVVLVIVLVVIFIVGGGGTLWALGLIDLPFFKRVDDHAGKIPVPRSARMIPAYTKLTREHIMDAQGSWSVYYIKPEQVTPKMITDYTKILGRVLNHDKPPGYAFTEDDFLPEKTRPGLVAGIPPGRRMITLDASKIDGFFGLQRGDHVDLTATFKIEMPKGGAGGLTNGLQIEAQLAMMERRARSRTLASDAVLVTPVTIREKPIVSRSTSGTKVKSVPVQEIDLAVRPDEIVMINEALATEVKITAYARSGQPGEEGNASEISDSNPLSDIPIIEAFVGNKRFSWVGTHLGDQSNSAKSHRRPADAPRQMPNATKPIPNWPKLPPQDSLIDWTRKDAPTSSEPSTAVGGVQTVDSLK